MDEHFKQNAQLLLGLRWPYWSISSDMVYATSY